MNHSCEPQSPNDPEREEKALELHGAIIEARQRTGIKNIEAVLGNEITICRFSPVGNWNRRIQDRFAVFGPNELDKAISFVEQMGL